MAHTDDLHDGDRVRWATSQGKATGQILRKATCRLYIADYEIQATPDRPYFIVRLDESGQLAAHRPSALRRIS